MEGRITDACASRGDCERSEHVADGARCRTYRSALSGQKGLTTSTYRRYSALPDRRVISLLPGNRAVIITPPHRSAALRRLNRSREMLCHALDQKLTLDQVAREAALSTSQEHRRLEAPRCCIHDGTDKDGACDPCRVRRHVRQPDPDLSATEVTGKRTTSSDRNGSTGRPRFFW